MVSAVKVSKEAPLGHKAQEWPSQLELVLKVTRRTDQFVCQVPNAVKAAQIPDVEARYSLLLKPKQRNVQRLDLGCPRLEQGQSRVQVQAGVKAPKATIKDPK